MLFFAENGEEALACLQHHDIDLMFLDLIMPVMDGFEVLKFLLVTKHEMRVVVLSADVQKQVMDNIDAGVVIIDKNYTVYAWNVFMGAYSGIGSDQVLRKNLFEVVEDLPVE